MPGADLREHGLVALTRRGHADQHRDVAVIVDPHRRPLAGARAAAGLDVRGNAEPEPTAAIANGIDDAFEGRLPIRDPVLTAARVRGLIEQARRCGAS